MKPTETYSSNEDGQLHFLARVCALPEELNAGTPESEYRLIWYYNFYIEDEDRNIPATRHEYDTAGLIKEQMHQHDKINECVFYAPALFSNENWQKADKGFYAKFNEKKPERQQKHIRYLKSFWIDIDPTPDFPTPNAIRNKFSEFADETGMLDANVEWMEVESGGGMHFYLPLAEPVPINEWQPVADALHSFVGKELGADKVTMNSACVLRMPWTMNRKRKDDGTYKYGADGKEVRWITDVSEPNQLDDIRRWLAANNSTPELPAQQEFRSFAPKAQPKIDDDGLNNMVTKCNMMQEIVKRDHADLHYDDWIQTMALVSKSKDPENAIRTILPERSARLDVKRGDKWITNAIKNWNDKGYAPPKCKKYALRDTTGACNGCPLHGKDWSSPVELAVDPYENFNDVEKAFVTRAVPYFESLGVKYNSLLDEDVPLNLSRIRQALNTCYMTNKDNNIINVHPNGALKLIKDNAEKAKLMQDVGCGGGSFFRNIDEFARVVLFGHMSDDEFEKVTAASYEKKVREFQAEIVHLAKMSLWSERNATNVDLQVDMFVDDAEMVMEGWSKVRIRMPFLGFSTIPHSNEYLSNMTASAITEIIDDYKDHFPQFDEFIDFVCHSRFAPTRRFSYLWLVCPSDWGKSFLLGLFGHDGLDILYEAQTDTIKDMTKGTTSGFTSEGLCDKWILFFDEASGAPKELKKLNDNVVFTPKWGSQTTSPLYAKVFACTNLPSSLTDFGVEDQFSNRFSLIRIPRKARKLTEREVFQRDTSIYRMVLVHYVKERMERRIREMRELGRQESERSATKMIAKFNDDHPLTIDGGLVETLQEIVEDMMLELVAVVNARPWHGSVNEPDVINKYNESGIHEYIGYAEKSNEKYVRITDMRGWIKEHIREKAKGEIQVKLSKSHEDLVELMLDAIQLNGGDGYGNWRVKTVRVVNNEHQYTVGKQRGHYIPFADIDGNRTFPEKFDDFLFPWNEKEVRQEMESEIEPEVEEVPSPSKIKASKSKTDESAVHGQENSTIVSMETDHEALDDELHKDENQSMAAQVLKDIDSMQETE